MRQLTYLQSIVDISGHEEVRGVQILQNEPSPERVCFVQVQKKLFHGRVTAAKKDGIVSYIRRALLFSQSTVTRSTHDIRSLVQGYFVLTYFVAL